MMELEELMLSSQAAAMGATLEEREVKTMRGSKQHRISPAIWYSEKDEGVKSESSHSFG